MPWFRRLVNTLRRGRVDSDIDRELAFHIAERVDQLRAQGLTESEALRSARLKFGNPVVQRERTRDVDIAHGVDTLFRQIRHAVRALGRTPGFTATVVLTLALGIGANSAVFSAMDAVLLRPLPFPDSDRLMRLRQVQETESSIAPPRLEDWNRLSASFEAISGFYVEDVSDTTGTLPQRIRRAVDDMAPLEERLGDAYAQNRLRTWLLTAFAVTALGLVCTGIYGTLSYAVSLRRREVALRLALGALRRAVVNQLMATTIRVVGISALVGLVLALLFAQSLSTMLYGVSPTDPAILSGVIAAVVAVAFIAALIPAARAAFVQPMRTLRED